MCAVSMCASSIRALGETMSAGRSGRGRRCGWLSRRAGRLRRNAAVWVVMAMVLSLVGGGVSRPGSPSGGSGKPAPADASKDAKGAKAAPLQVGEVADLRTATSRTKRDATGRLTTTVYAEPVNYRDTSGRWVPIDTRLSATGDGWANTTNSFQTRFRRALSEGFLRLDVAGQPYTLSMTGAAAAPATVDGARVSYTGVGPGVYLRYELSAVGVKETLVLADAAAPTSYRFSLATPAGVTAVQRADGSVELRRAGTAAPVPGAAGPDVHHSARCERCDVLRHLPDLRGCAVARAVHGHRLLDQLPGRGAVQPVRHTGGPRGFRAAGVDRRLVPGRHRPAPDQRAPDHRGVDADRGYAEFRLHRAVQLHRPAVHRL